MEAWWKAWDADAYYSAPSRRERWHEMEVEEEDWLDEAQPSGQQPAAPREEMAPPQARPKATAAHGLPPLQAGG